MSIYLCHVCVHVGLVCCAKDSVVAFDTFKISNSTAQKFFFCGTNFKLNFDTVQLLNLTSSDVWGADDTFWEKFPSTCCRLLLQRRQNFLDLYFQKMKS